jgi:hypothetical protein
MLIHVPLYIHVPPRSLSGADPEGGGDSLA